MKIKAKQYAISLFESLSGKSEKEQKDVINNFTDFLISNNDISKTEEAISFFVEMWNKKEEITEAEIVSAREIDKQVIKDLKDFIAKRANSKKVIISEEEDVDILGGVILRYGDKLIDLSLRNKINKYKVELIN